MSNRIGHALGDPPYHYDRGEEITVVFRTDRDVLQSLLPPVLTIPEGPSLAVVRVVHQLRSTFGPYIGVYLSTPALLDGEPVSFGLTGMKTNLAGTLAGREVWGMPLQVGDVEKVWDGDVLRVTAGRRGVDFVRLSLRLERRMDPPPPGARNVYATRRQLFDRDSDRHVLVSARGKVNDPSAITYWSAGAVLALVGGEPGDDWSLLPVHEVVDARFNTGGHSSLDRGEILREW